MGFLNESDSLAYFSILENCRQVCFFFCFFKTLSFLSLLVGFFRGQRKTYLATPYCFSWLKKTKYQNRIFLAFYTKFKRHTLQRRLSRNFGQARVHVKYVLLKGALMSKTVSTFVQKVGLIWLKGGFLLQLFRTQM